MNWPWKSESDYKPPGKAQQRHDLRRSLVDRGSWVSELGTDVPDTDEMRYVQRRIQQNPMWTVDRGTGFYGQQRLDRNLPSLLSIGRSGGKSNVLYSGLSWGRLRKHILEKDFFITAVHARFRFIIAAMFATYFTCFGVWATIYYVTWVLDDTCFVGINSFLSAFLFAIETQWTIGYGTHAIGDCWLVAWLVAVQCTLAVLLESVFLGVVFAKISHPKGRSRTIVISEVACIARRNGVLKFMFRVADIRKRTTISPRISAQLYTWAGGMRTIEGENLPITVQPLELQFYDPAFLLPVVVEHTIDERSPLYGHTADSLEALGAEIVVAFDGTNELGDTFTARQSYLPPEIHWGCHFANVIKRAAPGHRQHTVDLSRFHDVEPQEGLALLPPRALSRSVVLGGATCRPLPRLRSNTLMLSDDLVVTPLPSGRWALQVRVGDSYPSQMLGARVRMYLYRYSQSVAPPPSVAAAPSSTASGDTGAGGGGALLSAHDPASPQQGSAREAPGVVPVPQPGCVVTELFLEQSSGEVLLRYPMEVSHFIDGGSPLRRWTTLEGMMADADAEVVVQLTATNYATSHIEMRSRVYSVLGNIRWGWAHEPCVTPPSASLDRRTHVHWGAFHNVVRVHADAPGRRSRRRRGGGGGGGDGGGSIAGGGAGAGSVRGSVGGWEAGGGSAPPSAASGSPRSMTGGFGSLVRLEGALGGPRSRHTSTGDLQQLLHRVPSGVGLGEDEGAWAGGRSGASSATNTLGSVRVASSGGAGGGSFLTTSGLLPLDRLLTGSRDIPSGQRDLSTDNTLTLMRQQPSSWANKRSLAAIFPAMQETAREQLQQQESERQRAREASAAAAVAAQQQALHEAELGQGGGPDAGPTPAGGPGVGAAASSQLGGAQGAAPY